MRIELPCAALGCAKTDGKCSLASFCLLAEAAFMVALGLGYITGSVIVVVCGHYSESATTLVVSMGAGVGIVVKYVRDLFATARLVKGQAEGAQKLQEVKQDLAINSADTKEVKRLANGNLTNLVNTAVAAAKAETKAEVIATVAVVAPQAVQAVVEKVAEHPQQVEQAYQRGREDEKQASNLG